MAAIELSTFLIVVSLALSLVGQAANMGFLVFAGYLPLGYALFRILSRNVEKRRLENYKFAILLSPLYGRSHRFATRLKMRAEEAKMHKYVKCPQCKIHDARAKREGQANGDVSKVSEQVSEQVLKAQFQQI